MITIMGESIPGAPINAIPFDYVNISWARNSPPHYP